MSPIKLLIAGDFSPRERVQELIDGDCYKALFPRISDIIPSVDYSIVNFESVIPSSDSHRIKKVGVHLSCEKNAIDLLSWLGFNMLTLANNHFMDYGKEGMINSLKLFEEAGFDYVGVGNDLKEAQVFRSIHISNKTVAIINACEHEFSVATDIYPGCNPLDIISITTSIKEAKTNNDYVIVITHGGNEHYPHPSPRMRRLFRFFVDIGADCVLNHHQHCFCGYEVYKGKPVFYGLGNFCFDSQVDIRLRSKTFCYGYMVLLKLSNDIEFELFPYEQCKTSPGVKVLEGEMRNSFDREIDNLNSIIADEQKLEREFNILSLSNKKFIYRGFRPYNSRLLNSLYYRGLIPSFLSKSRLMVIRSIIECEAHYDLLIQNLEDDYRQSFNNSITQND